MYKLSYLRMVKYEYCKDRAFDCSKAPRPYYNMAYLFEGNGRFEENGKTVDIAPGDIIFIPIASRYISHWYGNKIKFITFHFNFLTETNLPDILQKVHCSPAIGEGFSFCAENCDGDDTAKLAAMGQFYMIMSKIFPMLNHENSIRYDDSVKNAVDYINAYSEKEICVPELAKLCAMSVSNFYIRFKKATGYTPVEYKNKIVINRASKLLTDETSTIEEISDTLGFSSSVYFRRLFKKLTGMSPTAYRKAANDIKQKKYLTDTTI